MPSSPSLRAPCIHARLCSLATKPYEISGLVVCDETKLDDKGCNGAPDMVIEIISPSSAHLEKVLKFKKYQHVGVREYWIVNPTDKTVTVFLLENGNYIAKSYGMADTVPVHVLEGCEISLPKAFPPTPG